MYVLPTFVPPTSNYNSLFTSDSKIQSHQKESTGVGIIRNSEGDCGRRQSKIEYGIVSRQNAEDTMLPQSENFSEVYVTADREESCDNLFSVESDEGRLDGEAAGMILVHNNVKLRTIPTPGLTVNCFRTNTHNLSPTTDTILTIPPARMITASQLRAKVEECANLNTEQRDQLYAVQTILQQSMSKRTGRCKALEYQFNLL
jgi:hypothetical protein